MNHFGPELDIAMDRSGRPREFADWFERCATKFNLTDSEIAEAYVNLRDLTNPDDDRKSNRRKRALPRTRIKEWRTGKPAEPETAYRIGRALQECGVPVTGLHALIAGHYFIELLGAVGAHISIGISRMTPPLHPFAPEIAHVIPMLDSLAPRISRELTMSKIKHGIRTMDLEEFADLQVPLSTDELYPTERTQLVDEGFMAWRYKRKEYFQKLPPAFAATIRLLDGEPTPEIVELAAYTFGNPQKDIMELLGFVTPAWVSRIRGDAPRIAAGTDAPPDYTAFNNFFDEYQNTFALRTPTGCRRSTTYQHVNVKLFESEYHKPATAVDVYSLVEDAAQRNQHHDIAVIEYLKQLAAKYSLTLATWTADDADAQRYVDCGFTACRAKLGMNRRLEWPQCDHKKETESA